MAEEIKSSKTLNLKGLLCPMPVVKLGKAIKEVNVAEIIEATATDPGVLADIPAWCKTTGNNLLEMKKEDKIFRFFVKRVK